MINLLYMIQEVAGVSLEWYERGPAAGPALTMKRSAMEQLKAECMRNIIHNKLEDVALRAASVAIASSVAIDYLGKDSTVYLIPTLPGYDSLSKEEFEEWENEYYSIEGEEDDDGLDYTDGQLADSKGDLLDD